MRAGLFCVVVVVVVGSCGDRELDCDPGHLDDNAVDVGSADDGCGDDDPCVLVSSSCSCSAGGEVVAVRAAAAAATRRALTSSVCTLAVSDDPGCFADAAVCDWGTCRLHVGDAPARRP